MPETGLLPLDGEGRAFFGGTVFDLADIGYCEAEYVVSGTADAYERTPDGVRPCEEAGFATRLVVHRPVEASRFNGSVWIEWLNVSGGLDAAPGWIFTHKELARRGAAWVGVSAQKVGVEGGRALLPFPSRGLVGTNPDRYGMLHHPGDRFSYDIFRLASETVHDGTVPALGGFGVERVIATGDSQSAFRLTTYVNEIDPMIPVHDGFMIHARGGSAAPLDDEKDPSAMLSSTPVLFRDDLRVPVMCVEAETDLVNLRYIDARQRDTEMLAVWEIAGASHADVYTFSVGPRDNGLLEMTELARLWRPGRELFGMTLERPFNAGPQHYVRSAAVSRLEDWIRTGRRPPESPRLATGEGSLLTDARGIVRGGIRTPLVDVPVAVLSGLGNSGGPIASLCGSTVSFDADQLAELYGSREDYLERFRASTQDAVDAGVVLGDDAETIYGVAESKRPL